MQAISTEEDGDVGFWRNIFREWHLKNEETDGAHNLDHVDRVWKLCQLIGSGEEGVDWIVLLATAYFHDVVSYPKNHPLSDTSAQAAAIRTRHILHELDFPRKKISRVEDAISRHSYSSSKTAKSIEEKIIQDADRIDALGAIGIARMFYTAGRMGSRLYDPVDPYAEHRSLDDKRFALDHIRTKLNKLVAKINTQKGKEVAEERVRLLETFEDQLAREIAL
jgi:uncharacterized protein